MNQATVFINAQWSTLNSRSRLFEALTSLSPSGQRAISLRFWEYYTIEEISKTLRISWDQTDKLIEKSLLELKSRLTDVGQSSVFQEAS